jgi:hypothetical protein
MAYRQPGVTVTQEFVSALPALAVFSLPNVIVGPVFYVASQASAGPGTYTGAPATLSYPGQPLGSYVDTRAYDPTDLISYPVQINFKNTIVQLFMSTTGSVISPNFNTFVDLTGSPFTGVVAGDMIVITSGADAGTYTIRSVTDANHVQTNETFPSALTGISYYVQRNIGLLNIPTSTVGVVITQASVTLPTGLTTTVAPFGSVMILLAEVLITYRAQMINRSNDIYEYANVTALEADFGAAQILPQNPAVFGAFLALNNAVTPTNILGLDANYLSNELLSYDDAFVILSMNDIYAISVMTQNTAVHTALKTHVDGYSQPNEKLERVGIINRQLVTTAMVDGPFTNGSTDATGFLLTSTGATFITDGVVPGDFVQVTSPTLYAGSYEVGAVLSQTVLQLVTEIAPTLSSLHFYTYQELQNSEQAATIAAYATSFGDSRMVLTWPDIVSIPVGNTIQQLPGYFLNCAVGALTTGLPTQQGLTNLSVAVYSGVVHSTKYFSNDDLNTIADGGVMIFVQDILNQTPLYIRHQLTTNRTSVLFQEYSVTKNVDFIAKFIRNNHKQFIGQYNIVEQTFDDLKTNAKGIINYLVEGTKLPRIGGVLVSGQLTSIEQNPDELDGILETWTITVPVPLNYLDITLVIS